MLRPIKLNRLGSAWNYPRVCSVDRKTLSLALFWMLSSYKSASWVSLPWRNRNMFWCHKLNYLTCPAIFTSHLNANYRHVGSRIRAKRSSIRQWHVDVTATIDCWPRWAAAAACWRGVAAEPESNRKKVCSLRSVVVVSVHLASFHTWVNSRPALKIPLFFFQLSPAFNICHYYFISILPW